MYTLRVLGLLTESSKRHHIDNLKPPTNRSHYTNQHLLCSHSNSLVNLMCRNMFVMDYFYNLRLMHLMVYRLQIKVQKLKLKLQNKSFRFGLGLAIDYMCVCVCRVLRVSAFLTILFLLSLCKFNMGIVPYFNFYEKCFFYPPHHFVVPSPTGGEC